MAQDSPTNARTDGEGITPDDVRADHQAAIDDLADSDVETSAFRALFDPPARAAILDALLISHPDPLTASEICEVSGITKSPFYDQIDYLLVAGVVHEAGKRGNAQTYVLATGHPVAQLLAMAKEVQTRGQTPMLLEDQFVGEPDAEYEPGDHPSDARSK